MRFDCKTPFTRANSDHFNFNVICSETEFLKLCKGFFGDGKMCQDMDECSSDPYQLGNLDESNELYDLAVAKNSTLLHNFTSLDNCDPIGAICTNIAGSFICECDSGE